MSLAKFRTVKGKNCSGRFVVSEGVTLCGSGPPMLIDKDFEFVICGRCGVQNDPMNVAAHLLHLRNRKLVFPGIADMTASEIPE